MVGIVVARAWARQVRSSRRRNTSILFLFGDTGLEDSVDSGKETP
jgi:hypothetical protein